MEKPPSHHEILNQISSLVEALRSEPAAGGDAEATVKRHLSSQSDLISYLHRLDRIREDAFGPDLFGDTAWHLLLEMFKSDCEQRPIHVSGLCAASKRSQTTALRCLADLEQAELIIRNPDPEDRRRLFVTLTERARSAMSRIYTQMSAAGRP